MCYKAPGPRCSNHALKALKAAHKAYRANPTEDARGDLEQARIAYEATPKGMKELMSEYEKTGDESLKARYERGKTLRKEQLAALGLAKDYGDIDADNAKMWHSVQVFEKAHQAGLAAREAALARGDVDLVESTVRDADGKVSAIANRESDFSGDSASIVFKSGREHAMLVKQQIKETLVKRDRKIYSDDESVWGYEALHTSLTEVRAHMGDAYNEAYAQSLRESGVHAETRKIELPQNAAELGAKLARRADMEKGWANHENHSGRAAKRRAYESILRSTAAFVEQASLKKDSEAAFTETLSFLDDLEHTLKSEKGNTANHLSAVNEVRTLVRWTRAAYRRNNAS